MQAAMLPGGRLHLNDGPIDLILWAEGDDRAVRQAFDAAFARFSTILDELCAELPLLRSPMRPTSPVPERATARRMDGAVRPLCVDRFVTRMAAVAGAVADEILAAMTTRASLSRAYVNNGGDIALHVAGDASLSVGLIDRPDRPSLFGSARIAARDGIGGAATSGWRGRSFSLGIADAVTVLARDAAAADAAATLIANAVDLPGHPAIARTPARDLDPQSDLGDRLVTRDVGRLEASEIVCALEPGEAEARRLSETGAIVAAAIRLDRETRVVGAPAPIQFTGSEKVAAE